MFLKTIVGRVFRCEIPYLQKDLRPAWFYSISTFLLMSFAESSGQTP